MTERVKGINIHRPIVYGSVARLLTPAERAQCKDENHSHTWTIFVRSATAPTSGQASRSADDELLPGGADDLGYFLKRVTFRLHESFPNPNRHVDKAPFQVTETGWGEFPLQIKLTFVSEAQEKPLTIVHQLKLHHWVPPPPPGPDGVQPPPPPPPSGPVFSYQYDELVFTNPPQSFLTILQSSPPTPLPVQPRKKDRPEFTLQMEREEADRMEEGRRSIVRETDRWRERLIEAEREMAKLKAELGAAAPAAS